MFWQALTAFFRGKCGRSNAAIDFRKRDGYRDGLEVGDMTSTNHGLHITWITWRLLVTWLTNQKSTRPDVHSN